MTIQKAIFNNKEGDYILKILAREQCKELIDHVLINKTKYQ